MLDCYKQITTGKKWIESLMREDMFKFTSKNETQLTSYIYPTKGSRMSYSDMSKELNKNHVLSTQNTTFSARKF